MNQQALIRKVIEDAARLSNTCCALFTWKTTTGTRRLAYFGRGCVGEYAEAALRSLSTSGMKAALNGVPSLSILDGWWIEGCIEGYTGWAIEDGASDTEEAASLYEKLETSVVPLYLPRGAVGSPDAQHAGLQRLLLQHQPHGEAVHAQRLLSGEVDRACPGGVRGVCGLRKNSF